MSSQPIVAVIPNPDGLGTSTWAALMVRALAARHADAHIKVVLTTEPLAAFHQDKYPDLTRVELVDVSAGIGNPLRLAKRGTGEVDVDETMARLSAYDLSRREHATALRAHLTSVTTVFELGVPQIALLVEELRAAGQAIRRVTVLDHAWSKTLREICGARLDPRVVQRMREDERTADAVWLLPPPVCPAELHDYWRETLGRPAQVLPAMFGGPHETLALARRAGLPGDDPRALARQLLGIENRLPTVHLGSGGTEVWREVLGAIVDDYLQRPPDGYNLVIDSRCDWDRYPDLDNRGGRDAHGRRGEWVETGRLRRRSAEAQVLFLGAVASASHPAVYPAFDLVVSRAGGGTVNAALAHGCRMLLVEEPGHWQVERIRRACIEAGHTPDLGLHAFKARARAWIEGRLRGAEYALV